MNLKQVARKVIPPIVLDARVAIINWIRNSKTVGERPFRVWWEHQRESSKIPKELKEMTDYFCATEESRLMSKYWWFLAKRNIEQIQNDSFANFKQTVARNYYTWVGKDGELLMSAVFDDLKNWGGASGSESIEAREIFRLHSHFSTKESIDFNINTFLFYLYVYKTYGEHEQILEEPSEGNPPAILINNKLVSQDILNSFLDYKSISQCCDLSLTKCVLELGAGYGRTAYYLLRKHTHLTYIIVDIPPALYIAQRYLTEQFPDKPNVKFSKNLSAEELQRAINDRAIIFLTPDQLRLVGDKEVDLSIAIDNLHAMSTQQVANYFDEFNRVSTMFYFTYWPGMRIPFDDYSFDSSKWPVKQNWQLVHEVRTKVPSCYVNICFKLT